MPQRRFFLPIPFQQFANQLVFLFAGKVMFKLSVTWVEIIGVLLCSLIIEHLFVALSEKKIPKFSPAAMSTAFNLAFMLGSTAFWIYPLALGVGLGVKNLFKKFNGEHFQNPSNLAIVFALLAFPQYTYVTFVDWGQTWLFAGIVVVLGSLILMRVGLFFLAPVYLASFVGFAYLFQTHNWGEILRLLSPAGFLLYAFFMVTDPRSLPKTKLFVAMHGVFTAFMYFVLASLLGNKEVNMFLALALASCAVPLFRYWERGLPALLFRRGATAIAAIALAAGMLYFSPWNIVRNGSLAMAGLQMPNSGETQTTGGYVPQACAAKLNIWAQTDPALYEVEWSKTHVVSRPLRVQSGSQPRFENLTEGFPAYNPTVAPKDLGQQYMPYAGAAVGDLNHDGAADVVLAKTLAPLFIGINDGRGTFTDCTADFFSDEVPADVEQAILFDADNDSWLDLLVVYSQYKGVKKPAIYRFDPVAKQFALQQQFDETGFNSGGVGFGDLNNDRVLDIYVSYGLNWLSSEVNFTLYAGQDVLYVSEGPTWRSAIKDWLPGLEKERFSGMTALFVDFNDDRRLDFLLGNDFEHPSIFYLGSKKGMRLAPAGLIENNTVYSMSYWPADFNNDGRYELWENGWSNSLSPTRVALGKKFEKPGRSALNSDFDLLEKQRATRAYDCQKMSGPVGVATCRDLAQLDSVHLARKGDGCKKIVSEELQMHCSRKSDSFNPYTRIAAPGEFTYDVERYPKQLKENVLLEWDAASKRYGNVIKSQKQAEFTGFTWAGAPADVNNDGYLDVYLTNGALFLSHDENRLLLNRAGEGVGLVFRNAGADWSVNLEGDGRGLAIADFDWDGDLDFIVNQHLDQPASLQNLAGGSAVLVSLRSKTANYYGIGAHISVETAQGVQTRPVILGGIWNTGQETTLHFGLGQAKMIKTLRVRWPSGEETVLRDIEPNQIHVIYQ